MKKTVFIGFGKNKTRIICSLLTIVMLLVCLIPGMMSQVNNTYAYNSKDLDGITSDSIKEKEEEIKKAKAEKERLKGLKSDIESIKQGLEQEKDNLSMYITQLDGTMAQIQYNIEDLSDQIVLKTADIEATEEELAIARDDEQARYDAMIVRMRLMYEKGDENILSGLLGATSLQDLLNRMDYVEAVVSYDRYMWEQLRQTRQYVELCEEQLEVEKAHLDESVASLEEEQKNMEALLEEKNRELTEYLQDLAEKQSIIDGYEDAMDDADDEIALLEAAILAEKKQIYDEQHRKLYDGGSFVFPIASYKYISSKFGYRTHPISGQYKFHSGVDIAANYGTDIYASYKGTVTSAGYNSSMGNYIFVYHGDSLYTVYMHCSSLYVKEGDEVTTGQTIAAVGSTGSSTGNHLHFSVRKNGEYVDPNDYVYFYDR